LEVHLCNRRGISLRQGCNQKNLEGRNGCRHYSTIQHSYGIGKIHENVSTQPVPKYVKNRLLEHEANIITTISNIQSRCMFLQAKVEMP